MAERYDVMVARDGNGKTYWTKIGVMFPNRNGDGFSISFEALPVPQLKDGKLEVRAVCFPPRDRDQQAPPAGDDPGVGGTGGLDDDVPF